ncbi:hypothetical protein OG592_27135 [Streptomyces avidinii]|uniref:hypothetical protein n=1 Tax=Streptomyces avidinii TaxID=1895 RepID=UPI0038703EFA|nr:hypothetical protein OG592_27135 [Streptomyces avidinii]
MDVAGYQLARRYAPVLDRVQAIADQAAFLVRQKLRGQMPPVRIVVAAKKHCPEVVIRSQQQILGVNTLPTRSERCDYLGITTLSPDGVLVVINAGSVGSDQRMLDETVVHELVHGVQYGRPGTREIALKGLRNNYGIERLSHPKAWKLNRQISRDEREAEGLEYLARQIR